MVGGLSLISEGVNKQLTACRIATIHANTLDASPLKLLVLLICSSLILELQADIAQLLYTGKKISLAAWMIFLIWSLILKFWKDPLV